MIGDLRRNLVRIQAREPMHAMIGAAAVCRDGTEYTLTTASICPRCPSRRDCKRASLRLADAETALLGATNSDCILDK